MTEDIEVDGNRRVELEDSEKMGRPASTKIYGSLSAAALAVDFVTYVLPPDLLIGAQTYRILNAGGPIEDRILAIACIIQWGTEVIPIQIVQHSSHKNECLARSASENILRVSRRGTQIEISAGSHRKLTVLRQLAAQLRPLE